MVHVDVVNAAARLEAEVLVGLGLGTPCLAERVDHRVLVRERTLHELVELFIQVVVGPRRGKRERSHLLRLQQVSADVVERDAVRLRRLRVQPLSQSFQLVGDRVDEAGANEKLDFAPVGGLDIDRDPVVLAVRHEMDLIVGRLA